MCFREYAHSVNLIKKHITAFNLNILTIHISLTRMSAFYTGSYLKN